MLLGKVKKRMTNSVTLPPTARLAPKCKQKASWHTGVPSDFCQTANTLSRARTSTTWPSTVKRYLHQPWWGQMVNARHMRIPSAISFASQRWYHVFAWRCANGYVLNLFWSCSTRGTADEFTGLSSKNILLSFRNHFTPAEITAHIPCVATRAMQKLSSDTFCVVQWHRQTASKPIATCWIIKSTYPGRHWNWSWSWR